MEEATMTLRGYLFLPALHYRNDNETMEGLPDFSIPTILSFLRIRDICRCACASKEWESCTQRRLIEMREEAARARAQMTEEEKEIIDEDLRSAANEGRLENLEVLIANGAHVDAAGSAGFTSLIYAARQGHLGIVEVLLINGANVDAINSNGSTALIWAACAGRSEVVKVLVTKGANVNVATLDSSTALILAACNGHLEIVEVLIDHGANVDAREYYGCTALIVAAPNGYINVLETLINAGASLNIKNREGQTALDWACEEVVDTLTRAGAKRGLEL